ncbi:hypothetical protein BX616_003145 [Lobosporangium transversale]|uniref:Class I glutamine amidotransferase-like protein n=1 Tax=Lobosporangium transversale TaxID=64571 RepID=A0A1Y2H033_9FUNG|nr:class I glutamine amidotransferase-like protein [Lobosporangium transversale]KAF9899248.1 hypothetical protein BX616_003145 [Lobosporangium transversale]ORZ27361.1 class I glutamine amidotransferase-like protein [Lobosporangium transversale]|eukprot:XP_021885088.1 class I glutamine amidotransferase-like protein [Lobosporangium transversale]
MKHFNSCSIFLIATSIHVAFSLLSDAAYHGPFPKVPKDMGTIQLGAFIFDNADLLDITGPMEVFGAPFNNLDIEVNFIGTSLKPVKTAHSVLLTPRYTLSNAPKMDLFFIPGGPGIASVMNSTKIMRQVTKRVKESTWTMTVCVGSAVLAKTGLMDGYNMTTNKAAFQRIVDNSKGMNINWIKRARWVQDGKYVTSSGVAAGMDAALYILSEFTSFANAQNVSNFIEYSWHKDANDDPFADLYP